MRAGRRLEEMQIISALAVFSKKRLFERPQAEFQIDASTILYTNCYFKQRRVSRFS